MNSSLELVSELGAHTEVFLALEAMASDSYSKFVFEDDSQRAKFNRELLRQGAGEFAPPHGMLALLGGRPVGMISCLTPVDLRKARLLAAVLLMRHPDLGSAVQARARLAAGALYRVQAEDCYLARIAVLPQEQGHGLGRQLLRVAEARARAHGMKRLTLDVAEDANAAQQFYRGNDFIELGRGEAIDPETGRRLAYLHLGKSLGMSA